MDAGPAGWGWSEDQRWTLARVKALIGRLFHIGYTIEGVGKLLRRHGCGWDNLSVHLVAELTDFAEANADWLRVYRFPLYAPELNPAEGV